MRKLGGLLLLLLVGCTMTDEPTAKRVLEDAGYKSIEFTGYENWLCGDGYQTHTGFRAKSPFTERTVEGAVCGEPGKGNVIKLK